MTTDRLTRGSEGRLVAGVCAGLGRYTGIDPLVYRIGWGVLLFVTWTTVPLYVLAAVMMAEPDGAPGIVERHTRRVIDGGAVLALLGLALAGGVIIDLVVSGAAGHLDADALGATMVVLLIALIAQARNVDLVATARGLPERLRGTPMPEPAGPASFTVASATVAPGPTVEVEWIDLATLKPFKVRVPADEAASGQPEARPSRPWTPPSPPQPDGPGRPAPKQRQGRALSLITLTLALAAAAAATVAAGGDIAEQQAQQLALAAGLGVIGLGLVTGTWFGRPRGLVAVGTLLSLALLTSAATTELPPGSRFGDVHWRPVDPNATQPYRIVAGTGTLDLTTLSLEPGRRYRVDARLGLGGIRIMLPAHARVELHAATGLGDITVDKKINSGPRVRVDQVLDGSGNNPPTLEIHVRGRIGDVEVIRGAA
ncbi:PspC domain-containing protein [Actinocorallia sp. API 0066]|uniref:PspC domain-containing protein n=1 Tax=Actinocorallia sp. API 0066 TaxID=2896846 RepID=UPI001E45A089|nr:PspC domain-containing protein [Actinocorallia sp. API 0066]MCD0453174.1 PspC domain-containing protein [Actinocorallia sp. API 0066]